MYCAHVVWHNSLRSNMSAAGKVDTEDIIKYFWAVKADAEGVYVCRCCNRERKCAKGAGWSNLMSHLNSDHPTFREHYHKALQQQQSSGLGIERNR